MALFTTAGYLATCIGVDSFSAQLLVGWRTIFHWALVSASLFRGKAGTPVHKEVLGLLHPGTKISFDKTGVTRTRTPVVQTANLALNMMELTQYRVHKGKVYTTYLKFK